MFNQNVHRVGFACKFEDVAVPNIKTTTITWLNNATKQAAEGKLNALINHNLNALYQQVKWVGSRSPGHRMLRISSDVLPAYTHDDWYWYYSQSSVQEVLIKEFQDIGDLARSLDVRLSFHPGQFCVLASNSPGVVLNSIMEFEYHCDMIRMMGYGQTFQDFKCNVHIGGSLGPDGIKSVLKKLSSVAKNVITIENDEFKWGLESSLELVDHCALVLDIHHHWIRTGQYIEPTDIRVKMLINSWRGVRPVIHYSVSREDVLDGCWDENKVPELDVLVSGGFTKAKLRAHSDYYWNHACNNWAYSFSNTHDIMLESKTKNLAHNKFCVEMNHI
jgi:UV DNA damage repair endonuclease